MTTARHGAAAPLLDRVLDHLGGEIVRGTLSEGKTFTLHDLSQRFDISRTVAREAMRALEQLGLVSSSRRVGITVQPRAKWAVFNQSIIDWRLAADEERRAQLHSLNELRVGIEPIAARRCASNASQEERQQLVKMAEDLRALGEQDRGASEEFLEIDIEFHSMLLRASGNEMFVALIPPVVSVLRGRTAFGLQPDSPDNVALSAHEQLAQSIMAGDPDAAEQHSRELLHEVRDALEP